MGIRSFLEKSVQISLKDYMTIVSFEDKKRTLWACDMQQGRNGVRGQPGKRNLGQGW